MTAPADPPIPGVRHLAATLLEAYSDARLSHEEALEVAVAVLERHAAELATAESGQQVAEEMLAVVDDLLDLA